MFEINDCSWSGIYLNIDGKKVSEVQRVEVTVKADPRDLLEIFTGYRYLTKNFGEVLPYLRGKIPEDFKTKKTEETCCYSTS